MNNLIEKFETKAGASILEKDKTEFVVRTESEFVYEYEYVTDETEAYALFKKCSKKLQLVEIINAYTTEMEGYSYFGSNPGVGTDAYEAIATEILNKFDLK